MDIRHMNAVLSKKGSRPVHPFLVAGIWVAAVCFLVTGCGLKQLPLDAINEPRPSVPSIIPLGEGNHWAYLYHEYDGTGDTLYFNDTLDLSIRKAFVVRDGRVRHLNDPSLSTEGEILPDELAFGFEWENRGSGELVIYVDRGTLHPQLMIVGSFRGDSASLYETPIPWFAYPAQEGFAWDANIPHGTDTTHVVFELLSKAEPATFFPESPGQSSGPRTVLSHLYRESRIDTTEYHYLHPDYGRIGFRRYVDGALRVSFVLISSSLY